MRSDSLRIYYLIPALTLLLLISCSQFFVTVEQKDQQTQKDKDFGQDGLYMQCLFNLIAIYFATIAITVPLIKTIVFSSVSRYNDIVLSLLTQGIDIEKQWEERREKANEFSKGVDRKSTIFISAILVIVVLLIVCSLGWREYTLNHMRDIFLIGLVLIMVCLFLYFLYIYAIEGARYGHPIKGLPTFESKVIRELIKRGQTEKRESTAGEPEQELPETRLPCKKISFEWKHGPIFKIDSVIYIHLEIRSRGLDPKK